MSVMNNKDRINENNDTINRLTKLVKQKALTSNPKLARSEEEMSAMLIDKNVGKVVKYLGESEAAVGIPIAIDDAMSSVYFDISKDIDPTVFDLNIDNNYAVNLWFNENHTPSFQFAKIEDSPTGQDEYMLFYEEVDPILWSSFEYADMGIVKGWQQIVKDTNGKFDIGETAPVNRLDQPDGWATFASKEPFAGGKYEKNALYIIAEGESEVIENPTAVGDEVTHVYFDTTKSAEEVYNALMQLDWNNPDYDGAIYLFGPLDGGGDVDNNDAITAINMSIDDAGEHVLCGILQYETPIFMYSPNITPSEAGYTEWGWQTASPIPSRSTFTIGYVGHKDIWGSWLSAYENGFTSIGEPAAPRARKLNITEGSLTITENGKFDVSNTESVEVNITNKLAFVAGEQSADNLYDITASDLEGLTEIGAYAFYRKEGLRSVALPTSCTSVSTYAFYICKSLATANMPNVTSIDNYAFYECTALTSASMPNVTSVGLWVFHSCPALLSVDMPKVTSVDDYAFASCTALTSVSMPNAISVGGYAFQSCTSLILVDIPKVTSISTFAFHNCTALTAVSMLNATSVGSSAFRSCSVLTSIDMPKVTRISSDAFRYCRSLTSVDMPKVTRIDNRAFQDCTSLTSLTISSTCTSIGSQALQCGSSTNKCTFTFEGTTPPTIASDTFNASYINKIIVPIGCGEAYKTATNWSDFADYIEEATE